MLSAENRTILGFEDLIEQEWIRYGYPFVPDPTDWHDDSVSCDYDDGACFALFIDCVHQLLVQFPTEFAFTEVCVFFSSSRTLLIFTLKVIVI